jgi:hypothetical protein
VNVFEASCPLEQPKPSAMNNILEPLLDWSEVWAVLMPLSVLYFCRHQPSQVKPVIVYLIFALVLNLVIDVIVALNVYFGEFIKSNNPYYNIQSIIRFGCFSYYFNSLPQSPFPTLRKWLPVLFAAFLLVDFIFIEDFFNYKHLSGNLMAAESYLLLICCLQYYLAELKTEERIFDSPHFWIVTGLAIYVVVNFFVFLFYVPLLDSDVELAINIWNVHNIAFIILCIFISKGFYVAARREYTG